MQVDRYKCFFIFFTYLFLQGCAAQHDTLQESSTQPSLAVMQSSLEQTLHPILRTNCARCHGASQEPKFADQDSEFSLNTILRNNLVNFSSPKDSRFVKKIEGGHNGFPISLSVDIMTQIEEWVLTMGDSTVDLESPVVSIASPNANMSVMGSLSITVTATDNSGVERVRFFANDIEVTDAQGNVIKGIKTSENDYTLLWDTNQVPNGTYELTARATDTTGNTTVSTGVNITINNPVPDTESPVVVMTAPSNNSAVSGTTLLSAAASDNTSVAGVQFYVGSTSVGPEDKTAPYSYALDSSIFPNGFHNVTARARDAAGNTMVTGILRIEINNIPPDNTAPTISVTAPSNGASVSGVISVQFTASDNVGVVGVQLYIDNVLKGIEDTSSPFNISLNTSSLTNGSHQLYGRARDAAGNFQNSAIRSITVSNQVVDSTAPTVSLTSPGSGATVSNNVTLTATASDNTGVAGVQFLINGVVIESEDTTPPYSVVWDSKSLANGSHSITARARDEAGNIKVSTARSVNVNNADVTSPTVSITSPSNGATVSASVNIVASAADNIAVAGVQFYFNGIALGSEDTTAPYSYNWDTTNHSNGGHTLTARARDTSGNFTTSSNRSITVDNVVVNPNAKFSWISSNILVPKCLNCHGSSRAEAGVRYDTYTRTLSTAKAGNIGGSKLYTECNSGSMPKGGNDLSSTEITAIADWINAGTPND